MSKPIRASDRSSLNSVGFFYGQGECGAQGDPCGSQGRGSRLIVPPRFPCVALLLR